MNNKGLTGAPEEIRTPDPQIRSLTGCVENEQNSSKPPNFAALTYQRLRIGVANQNGPPPDPEKEGPSEPASSPEANTNSIRIRKNTTARAATQDRPRQRDFNVEARIQAAIVEYIRVAAPDVFVFAVPNGGLRSKSEAARMKWTGTVAGVPDLCVIADPGRAFFLETKGPTGSVSAEQRRVMLRLGALRAPSAVVKSIDDVRRAFEIWGLPTREAGR